MRESVVTYLFSLLRSALCGGRLTEQECNDYSEEYTESILKCAAAQDVDHLVALALKQNGLLGDRRGEIEKRIFKAVYRYESLKYEYDSLCNALEGACIPFVPLKGAVIRRLYPEAWMRTSCDIDILVHRGDLDKAASLLREQMKYSVGERDTHDISMFSPGGVHVELHFDLVEEGRANNACSLLSDVWNHVSVCNGTAYRYEMSDAFFYFYHVAHMAKHFENGGCGIRPFIDLWLLERMEEGCEDARNELLSRGGLLRFAEVSRKLSRVWFSGDHPDELSLQMQYYLLSGGIYGSVDNKVAVQQGKKGGKLSYIFSRMFASYDMLKRYYPILEKHRWLMPVCQVRRWFMLFDPKVAKMARQEVKASGSLEEAKAEDTSLFIKRVGL